MLLILLSPPTRNKVLSYLIITDTLKCSLTQSSQPKAPAFYGLPKIHKAEPIPVRYIASSIVHEPGGLNITGKGTKATIPFWKANNVYIPKMHDGHLRCVAVRSYYIINEAKSSKMFDEFALLIM